MLIISQNLENYDLMLPKEAVFRINLAWCNSLEELEGKLANIMNNPKKKKKPQKWALGY